MEGSAVILTGGLFSTEHAKTAHGLVRGTERFKILGIIDEVDAGKDAGEVLDGIHRNIPIHSTLADYLAHHNTKPDFCIVGIANAGGVIPPILFPIIETAIRAKIGIVSGLHEFISEIPQFVSLANSHEVRLIDVRKPKPRNQLHFWSGEIYQVGCPIVAVMGQDVAIGKRTTSRFLVQACKQTGIKAEMIYTGQTGWMQGAGYGFILDSTVNDFVSGELEYAIVSCYRDLQPDVIFVEGQAALRNPSGPCGSEFLVSGNARYVILQVSPGREFHKGMKELGLRIASVASEIELISMYNSRVIALSINNSDLSREQAFAYKAQYETEFGLPVALPLEEGVDGLVGAIRKIM